MTASVILPVAIPFLFPSSAPAPTQSVPVVVPVLSAQGAAVLSDSEPAVDWTQVVLVLWIVSSALLSASLIVSNTKLRRRLRRYRRTSVDGHALLVSENFGPAVVGLLHPTIVLPAWTLNLPVSERRLVVSHELEHQRARDPLITIAGLLLVALLPWNLALWWQLSRLRLAIEFDCDARVLSNSGADPFAYGHLLLIAHEHAGPHRLAALALAPIRSALGKRVDALVVPGAKSARRTLTSVAVAALALSALGFAPIPELPTEALRPLGSLKSPAPLALSANSQPAALMLSRASNTPSVSASASPLDSPTLRDREAKTVVAASRIRLRRAAAKSANDSGDGSVAPAAQGTVTRGIAAPDSTIRGEAGRGGSFGVISAAVMQRASGGTVVLSAEGGGRGGLLINSPPLKTYTGGFMNAEVPARPDSARSPLR